MIGDFDSMSDHIKKFYSESLGDFPNSHYHLVIALNEAPDIEWPLIHAKVPLLPRGWFELARLTVKDRVEFTRDFWIKKLPYHPYLHEFIVEFFSFIEDIQIFLVQQKFDDPFEAHLVYCLKKDNGFFKGYPPALESDLLQLQADFPDVIFPKDYLAFLEVHNGLCKTTDCTGIFRSHLMKDYYDKFQKDLEDKEISSEEGTMVNPKSLIPFYESFGMPFYQCFFKEWYPEDEMGNVYYSGNTNTISDVKNKDPSREAMAFPTFSDWLTFYLEAIG